MHWRLRSRAGAFYKGDILSVILALLTNGTLVMVVVLFACAGAIITMVEVLVIMCWHLRSQNSETACASCKSATECYFCNFCGWHERAARHASSPVRFLGDRLCADLVHTRAMTASSFC